MNTEEIKNNEIKITEETHIRTTELEEILGVKSSTYYKDIKFLEIQLFKDDNKRGYILRSELQILKDLREYVKINGKRTGFMGNNSNKLATRKESKIAQTESNKNSIQSNQEIYVQPEEPTENIDTDYLVRKGAELKAREIAMPHLVVRAIADKIDEEELPQDLQQNIQDAREVASPKYSAEDLADSILMNWRNS